MSDFFRTGMGHKFYEGTMPALVAELRQLNNNLAQLQQLNDNLKTLLALLQAGRTLPSSPATKGGDPP